MKLLISIAAAALLATPAFAAPAFAAPCRDAHGRFAKCPPASTTAAMTPAPNKDAKGHCHVASGPKKGQFTACPH